MNKYIKNPIVIHKDKYEFEKENLFGYKIVKKSKDFIYLLNEDDINDEFFLSIDIIEAVSKEYPKQLFCIIETKEEDVFIFFGHSDDCSLETVFIVNTTLKSIKEIKKQINKKISLLESFTNFQGKFIYFSLSEQSDIVATQLFGKKRFIKKDFFPILKKIKITRKPIEIIKPIAFALFIGIVVYNLLGFFIDNYTKDIVDNNKMTKNKLIKELKQKHKLFTMLQKKHKDLEQDMQNIEKFKNNIFREEQK